MRKGIVGVAVFVLVIFGTFLLARGQQTGGGQGAAATGTVTVVSAGTLTSTAIVTGGGTQTLQTPSATSTLSSSGNMALVGSLTTGTSPGCTAGTAGGMCSTEGTAPTALASVDEISANSTLHDWAVNANGGVSKLLVSSIGYNSGSISASVGVTNIASAANFPTGQYELNCDVVVTAVGSSPTLAVTIGWTDISGTARTKTCVTGTVAISDNPNTQTITSNGSAAITVTQTLAVSTATWQTTAAITRLQ
jgi:hypothetical protein